MGRILSAKFAAVAFATLVLGGCGSLDGILPNATPTGAPTPVLGTYDKHGRWEDFSRPAQNPAEKLVVLPPSSADIVCPIVEIREGGAALRTGGPSNESVRMQFQVDNTARECDPGAGPNQITVKIGVQGKLLIGPAGSPGTYGADLHVAIRHDTDQKIVVAKSYRVSATSNASGEGPFEIVTEPFALTVEGYDAADQYSIFVGFGAGDITTPKKRTR